MIESKGELTITIGLPGSGKSSWAKDMIKSGKGRVVELNRDDMRNAFASLPFKERERLAHLSQTKMANLLLREKKHVIISDTNLSPTRVKHWEHVASNTDSILRKVMFTHVGVETCVARDQVRRDSVGSDVIHKMAHKAITDGVISSTVFEPVNSSEMPPVYQPLGHLQRAVIVDVDGTVAVRVGRGPYEWNRVSEDVPFNEVVDIVKSFAGRDRKIIFVSGRDGVCEEDTMRWLEDVFDEFDFELHMRSEGDVRPDDVVKEEIFWSKIANFHDVDAVFDDRDRVVAMWRRIGLTCLQVNWGNF